MSESPASPPAVEGSTPLLMFLHVPKAAGSTFKAVLRRVYDPDRIRYFNGTREAYTQIKALEPHEWFRFDVLAGHFFYGVHYIIPRPTRHITMLRHPVDRVVSYFYYIKSDPTHPLHEVCVDAGSDIAGFMRSTMELETNDFHVRMIAGGKFGRPGFGEVGRDMLEAAKRRLDDEFAAFGIVEEFDDSVRHFADVLGWPAITAPVRRANVSKDRPSREQLGNRDRGAIEQFNALDLELYEHACDLFERRLAGESRLPGSVELA